MIVIYQKLKMTTDFGFVYWFEIIVIFEIRGSFFELHIDLAKVAPFLKGKFS